MKRPDADELLAIRGGAWTYDDLIAWAKHMDGSMAALEAASSLPRQPDRDAIDMLCVELVADSLTATRSRS